MSDKDKVLALAREISPRTIVLRWEAAGDCRHVVDILRYIGQKNVGYDAYINLFEEEGTPIANTAREAVMAEHWPQSGQTVHVFNKMDLTRNSKTVKQPEADIIFIRNVMPTNVANASLTTESDELLAIHKNGVRERSNSLTDTGRIELAMHGKPGVIDPPSGMSRANTKVKDLFHGFDQLNAEAAKGGTALVGGGDRAANLNMDVGEVMRNDGTKIMKGKKQNISKFEIYYLTYQKSRKI